MPPFGSFGHARFFFIEYRFAPKRQLLQLHLSGRKRPFVCEFGDAFVRRSVPVRSLRLDAYQNRVAARLYGLHRRDELKRVARHNPIVMVGRRGERRRIAHVGIAVPAARLVSRLEIR